MAHNQPPHDGPHVALCVQLDGAALRRAGEYDTVRNTWEKYLFGAGGTSNEAPFAPRAGARDEDDGYVVTFVADANAANSSEVVILDAKNFAAGPSRGADSAACSGRLPLDLDARQWVACALVRGY